jgi:hypothetical protein
MRDYVSVTSATRGGVRIASANAGSGQQFCDAGETGTECSNVSSPEFAKQAANAIQIQGSALNKDQINYMLIYKSNDKGYAGTLTSWGADPLTSCVAAGKCVVYRWVKASDKFKYSSGTWTGSSVNACVSNSDSVGVYVNTTHPYITKFFGSSINLSDRTIMRFEPLNADTCSAGTHQ